MELNHRFKGASYYENSKDEKIFISGLGGVGSYVFFFLSRSLQSKFILNDFDKVELHNVGTQLFPKRMLGEYKIDAAIKFASEFGVEPWRISKITSKFEVNDPVLPIVITGFDNMEGRRNIFEAWKQKEDREIFIDARLRADFYEVFTVIKGREELYEKTLFDDSEASVGPCTFQQSSYFAGLIGARITNIFINYLTNKYQDFEICELPFKISEKSEMFYIMTE